MLIVFQKSSFKNFEKFENLLPFFDKLPVKSEIMHIFSPKLVKMCEIDLKSAMEKIAFVGLLKKKIGKKIEGGVIFDPPREE